MRILIKTYGCSSFMGESQKDDLECAILEVTPALVEQLKERANRFRFAYDQDRNLSEMTWHAAQLDVYSFDLQEFLFFTDGTLEMGEESLETDFEDGGYCILPDRFDQSKFEQWGKRTESDYLHVSGHYDRPDGDAFAAEVYWSMLPKHGDARVETAPIPIKELMELLAPA